MKYTILCIIMLANIISYGQYSTSSTKKNKVDVQAGINFGGAASDPENKGGQTEGEYKAGFIAGPKVSFSFSDAFNVNMELTYTQAGAREFLINGINGSSIYDRLAANYLKIEVPIVGQFNLDKAEGKISRLGISLSPYAEYLTGMELISGNTITEVSYPSTSSIDYGFAGGAIVNLGETALFIGGYYGFNDIHFSVSSDANASIKNRGLQVTFALSSDAIYNILSK